MMEVRIGIIKKLHAVVAANRAVPQDNKTLAYWNMAWQIMGRFINLIFPGNRKAGGDELDYRERIDMAKISDVVMGVTNNGRDSFTFYAEDGQQAIQISAFVGIHTSIL